MILTVLLINDSGQDNFPVTVGKLQIQARGFSRGRRTILLLRSGASADRRKHFRSFSDGGALPRRRYAHVAHLHLVWDLPGAMTAQFSNSNGGMG
jgi:hypothetical protein